jgi:hypothetical protein
MSRNPAVVFGQEVRNATPHETAVLLLQHYVDRAKAGDIRDLRIQWNAEAQGVELSIVYRKAQQ